MEKKLEVKEAKEAKAAQDKILADKKAEVQGIPVIPTPKPEVKPLMNADEAIKKVKADRKEAAELKELKENEEAKMKSLEHVGEKKDEEVPVSKCPSEIKKEKEEKEKAIEDAAAKAKTAELVAK